MASVGLDLVANDPENTMEGSDLPYVVHHEHDSHEHERWPREADQRKPHHEDRVETPVQPPNHGQGALVRLEDESPKEQGPVERRRSEGYLVTLEGSVLRLIHGAGPKGRCRYVLRYSREKTVRPQHHRPTPKQTRAPTM